ncbi:MAG: hypothetical protein JRJ12_00650 [Deltaproteobacteria bacterium]|nr:hypothetical protein [Deltaproteobacteria bacterium]MBW2071481.1 hypothetical protein [Deltaproteobacteria bacterium]
MSFTETVENNSEIQGALLLYEAKALRQLDLLTAAREVLTTVLRRKKGTGQELLRALRYEQALVHEGQGQRQRACNELEKLYAQAPDFEDVAAKLGL